MKQLDKEDLKKIQGGGINLGGITIFSLGLSFIVGVVDGFLRPLKCNY